MCVIVRLIFYVRILGQAVFFQALGLILLIIYASAALDTITIAGRNNRSFNR